MTKRRPSAPTSARRQATPPPPGPGARPRIIARLVAVNALLTAQGHRFTDAELTQIGSAARSIAGDVEAILSNRDND